MDSQKKRQIQITLRQLAEDHARTVATCLAEALQALDLSTSYFEPRLSGQPQSLRRASDSPKSKILDPQLLTVVYRGKRCFLGNTLPYRLMERLARQPDRYVSYQALQDDVWHELRSREAIRSVVKVLRGKLREAGLDVIAAAIDGHVAGHYALMLSRLS